MNMLSQSMLALQSVHDLLSLVVADGTQSVCAQMFDSVTEDLSHPLHWHIEMHVDFHFGDAPGLGVVQVELGGAELVEVIYLLVVVAVGQVAVLQQPVQRPAGQVEDDLGCCDVLCCKNWSEH